MKRNTLTLLALASLLAGPALAATPEELRAELNRLSERGEQAKSEGRPDEADHLLAEAGKLEAQLRDAEDQKSRRDKAGKSPENKRDKLAEARRQIQELRNAGKAEEAERLEQRMREVAQRGGDRKMGGPGDPKERAQHVAEAVKHLRAAGLHEPAEHIARLARRLEEDSGDRGHSPESEQTQHAVRELHRNLDEVRREVQRLAASMNEIRGHLKMQREDRPVRRDELH